MVQHAISYLSQWLGTIPHTGTVALATFAAMAALYLPLEYFLTGSLKRYLTWTFLNDFTYGLVARIGTYGLIYGPVLSLLRHKLGFLHFGILEKLPAIPALLVSLLILDCIGYWIHRLQHHSDYLWSFHAVHHAQTNITFMTAFRSHILDEVHQALIGLVPGLILGFPEGAWAFFAIVRTFNTSFVHTGLPIGYGPFYRVFVSPKFHSYHHSADVREYMGNYGTLFTVWDQAFGTFVQAPQLPPAYGIAGTDMGTSIVRQFFLPFVPAAAALRNMIRIGPRRRLGTLPDPPGLPSVSRPNP
jgi:sterol desaturase/sphingolipid hydroxylase (fatty acid hydroxylase superfamily)